MKNFNFQALSIVLLVLFCWIIYPVKWTKKIMFELRKTNAIRKANHLCAETNKQVYVVQNGMKFEVGFRHEFRKKTNSIQSELVRNKKGYLRYSYKNAIIYKSKS